MELDWEKENQRLSKFPKHEKRFVKAEPKTLEKNYYNITFSKSFIPIDTKQYFKKQIPTFSNIDQFTDVMFLPELRNVVNLNLANSHYLQNAITEQQLDSIKDCEFKRPSEIFKNERFYVFNEFKEELIQPGQLDNSYFLIPIISLMQHNKTLIKNLFIKSGVSSNGTYGINCFVQGKKKIVLVDDNLPVHQGGSWIFSNAGQREIYIQLLEKAWAKVNGSYAATLKGRPEEVYAFLTEAPCINHKLTTMPLNCIWELLNTSNQKKFIMNCFRTQIKESSEFGLDEPSNIFIITNVYESEGKRLLKIYNKWIREEFEHDYSLQSFKWTPSLKNLIGFNNLKKGERIISLEEFMKYFSDLIVVKIQDYAHYNYKKFVQDSNNAFACAKFKINSDDTDLVVTLHQKQQRLYNKVSSYIPQMGKILLAKFNDEYNKYDYVNSEANNTDEVNLDLKQLKKGEYHIFFKTSWPYGQARCTLVLSNYSNVDILFEELDPYRSASEIIPQIFNSLLDQKYPRLNLINQDLSMQTALDNNKTGFYFLRFQNAFNDEKVKLLFTISYSSKLRMINLNKFTRQTKDQASITDTFELQMNPKSEEMIILEQTDRPNYRINLSEIQYSSEFLEKSKESIFIDNVIQKEYKSLEKEKLNSDCYYSELETDEGIILNFENLSLKNGYKFAVNFTTLENLQVIYPKENTFLLEPNSKQAIFLKALSSTNPYDFNFNYSYKIIN